jgi:hypothetical protein
VVFPARAILPASLDFLLSFTSSRSYDCLTTDDRDE